MGSRWGRREGAELEGRIRGVEGEKKRCGEGRVRPHFRFGSEI